MKLIRIFERAIVVVLIALMMLVIFLSTVELGYLVVTDILSSPNYLIGITELLRIFGFFLLVLIGIELLGTIEAYFEEHAIHDEVVLIVAIIAVARKVIVLDLEKYTSDTLFAIAAILLALSLGYFLVKRARISRNVSVKPGRDAGV